MTKEDADYCIDKGLATGVIDSNGDLTFHMRGTREEIIDGMMTTAKAWNQPVTRAEAERLTDKAIRGIWVRRLTTWILLAIALAALVAIVNAAISA